MLAHVIADYPLQTDWIVRSKHRVPVLLIHVGMHLGVMSIITCPIVVRIWPFLLAVTVLHFSIDYAKIHVSRFFSKRVVGLYLMDQCLHGATIAVVAYWIEEHIYVEEVLLFNEKLALYGIGYLLVSHVWFVTERVCAYNNKPYQAAINRHAISRMTVRVGLLTMLLFYSHGWFFLAMAGYSFIWPYTSRGYRRRECVTDIAVVLMTWGFLQLAHHNL